MMMRTISHFRGGRFMALAAAATLALPLLTPLAAAPAGASEFKTSAQATDFSAGRRHYHHHRHGGAAAAAAFAGVVGTIGAIAATQAARGAYYDAYAYDAPYAYAPAPYYAGPRYVAPYGGQPYGTYGSYGSSRVDPGGNNIP